MFSIVLNMDDSRWASKFRLAILGSTGPEGGRPWMFQRGANFYDDDPLHQLKSLKAALLERQEKTRLMGWARAVSEVDLEPVCMQMSWFCDNVKWLHLNLSCH